MSVLSLLTETASKAVLSKDEQSSIQISIATLEARLGQHFTPSAIKAGFRFGSSTRGTILPRSMDPESDIDYMLLFSDGGFVPQTYLNRLRGFVEQRYPRSSIYQSSPTIVLKLNHIKFDLVPATSGWLGGTQIPDKKGDWMSTNPNDFNATLEAKNRDNNSLIKPTIRLMKYWNARSGFPFESFVMEKWICGLSYFWLNNQKDYLFAVFDKLGTRYDYSQRVNSEIIRGKDIVAKVRQFEKDDMPLSAEQEMRKLFRM